MSDGSGISLRVGNSEPRLRRQHLAVASGTTLEPATAQNAFTIDVEDYFQVEAFRGVVDPQSWESRPARVDENTQRVLELLAGHGAKATFFVLGWVAQRHPQLVRRIGEGGHEVASHGYAHERAHTQSPEVFRADVRRARELLEDIAGVQVKGYRAPTFSIGPANLWAYDILGEEGYAYSSSLYPVSHDLYGAPDAPTSPFRPRSAGVLEIPLTTASVLGRNIPCSGGGYFRLMPYGISRWCMARARQQRRSPIVFYCHPWEFDPEQPRIPAGLKSRFRHYTNLGKMQSRVARLLTERQWNRMDHVFAPQLGSP